MDLPFALVGGHPSCQIRIDKRGTPDLVYIVFSFNETIEVWPTTAVAFPQWGPLAVDTPLMVGGTRIHFEQQLGGNPHSENYKRSSIMHILDVDGGPSKKKRSVVLEHRVQIVGGDHPSTIRIRNVGLRTCEQAIVSFDECCWQINLRQNTAEPDRVRQVFVDNDRMKIGELNAAYRTKIHGVKKTSSGTIKLASSNAVAPAASEIVDASEALDSTRESDSGDEADGITEAVTNRLVTLNRTRSFPTKVIKWGLWLLLVAAAGTILGWIAKELAPLIGGL